MGRTSIARNPTDGDDIVFVHGYRDLRRAAADWQTFSNDVLGRIQIPGEDKTRPFRQYPIECDPPLHGAYRAIVQDMFNKPFDPAFAAGIAALVDDMVAAAQTQGTVEVVADFALPLQSRALTHLLGMPLSEADLWIGWGMHVFRSPDGDDLGRAQGLIAYLGDRLDHAEARWPDSLFAHLGRVQFDGRPLTRDEKLGFAHLVFAGGRDTVIRTVAASIAWLAQTPADFARIKADPALAVPATEELVRVLSPLTYLGRVCPHGGEVAGTPVAPGQRIALCFADANRDPDVFAVPDLFDMDRRPNPHVGFGSGPHTCPGSAHARLLARTVMQTVARRVERLTVAADAPRFSDRFDRMEIGFG
jgi:cytochrome P450